MLGCKDAWMDVRDSSLDGRVGPREVLREGRDSNGGCVVSLTTGNALEELSKEERDLSQRRKERVWVGEHEQASKQTIDM